MKISCSLGKEVGESGKWALMLSPWPGYQRAQFQITVVGVQLRRKENQVFLDLQHPRRLSWRCETVPLKIFENSPVPLNYTGLTDEFLSSKCKDSSHTQSILLRVFRSGGGSLLLLLAVSASGSSPVPQLHASSALQSVAGGGRRVGWKKMSTCCWSFKV